MSDDPVVSVGDPTLASGRPPGGSPARGSWIGPPAVLGLFVALLALLGAVGSSGDDTIDLASPPETIPMTSPRPSVPDLATGWQRLDLPGVGTVVGLAHGGAGWVAVAGGDVPTVSVSSDGQVWLTRDFPGTFHGEVRTLVTDTAIAVVDSTVTGGSRSWYSTDQGATWETALFPGTNARIDTVSLEGSRLLAGGSVMGGEQPAPETSMPAVWEYANGTWTRLDFSVLPRYHGAVAAIVGDAGGVRVLGRADGLPASWSLDGDTLVARPIRLPFPAEAITGVIRTAEGSWIGEFDGTDGVAYASTEDLIEWTRLGVVPRGGGGRSMAAATEGVVMVGDDPQAYRVAGRAGLTDVRYRYPGVATGFEADRRVEVVASDGERIVMGGGSGTSTLWIRGASGGMVGVTSPPGESGRWTTVQRFGHGSWDRDPRPFEVAAVDGLYLATPRGVWRTADPVTEIPRGEGLPVASIDSTSEFLFLVDTAGRLHRRVGDRWETETPGFPVAGVTEGGSGVLAFGSNGQGAVAVRSSDGSWQRLDIPAGMMPIAGHDGEILGLAGAAVLVGSDGVDWTPADAVGFGGLSSGIPFLITSFADQGSSIRLLGDGTTLTTPSIDPVEVVRAGSTVRVRGSDGLWETSDDGATWTRYPIGLEYRLSGSIRLLPTETPMLLMATRDSYRLLLFEP